MKVEFYKDGKGEWRWKLVARNGKIVADGAEGYKSKRNVVRAWERAWKQLEGGPIIQVIPE